MKTYKNLIKKSKNIGILNGITTKTITIYRAELIHLRNEGMTSKKIASLLNTKITTVDNWFNKGSQPKDVIIKKLEQMFLERELKLLKKLRNPKD